jgi:5'-deoxynucleotidase YfbR-like HD superfamily hydrolase
MDDIEEKVDRIKHDIGEVKVESFDKLKEEYEQKYKDCIKKIESELVQKSINDKGVLSMLKELKGTMNDSIRVLKCVTHEENVWFLIEEDIEVFDEEMIPQYWIREADLKPEEKEYLHEYLPQSMREEDAMENLKANKLIKQFTTKLNKLRKERQDLLKECREIRFGIKISYY